MQLPPGAARRLRHGVQFRLYARHTTVFRQGETPAFLYFLCTGWVKLFCVSRDGRAATVALAGPGSVVGLRDIFLRQPYAFTAEALERAEFVCVDGLTFKKLVRDEQPAAALLLQLLSREAAGLAAEFSQVVAKLPPIDRLLHILEDLAANAAQDGRDRARIRLPLTVQDLADRIGCSRQWTSKILSDLEKGGRIRRTQGWIALVSRPEPQVLPTKSWAGSSASR